MAGMFSLLHKSQLRLDANAATASADDCNVDFRSAPANRSPMPGRRILGIGQVHMKTLSGQSDRLPKRFRKRRCHEIHPLLRRSVCTLLLAGVGIISGFTIIIVNHYSFQKASTTGIVILSTSVALCFIGVGWLCWSMSQLRNFKKKILEVKAQREKSQEKIESGERFCWNNKGACDPAALSAAKWPVRRNSEEKVTFRCEITRPYDKGPDLTESYLFQHMSSSEHMYTSRQDSCSSTESVVSSSSVCSDEMSVTRRDTQEYATLNPGLLEAHPEKLAPKGNRGSKVIPEIFVTNDDGEPMEDIIKLQEMGIKHVKRVNINTEPVQ